MTSISQQIRDLAREGSSVTEIARALSIRYQHAYKVCRDAGLLRHGHQAGLGAPKSGSSEQSKPRLSVSKLLEGGFTTAGCWLVNDQRLTCPSGLPHIPGVYAFSVGAEVTYVGLASRSLAQRIHFYGNPAASQRTNIRLNALVFEALESGDEVNLHFACPPSFKWNEFTISGPEGLEAGLIQSYFLPWNVRGA